MPDPDPAPALPAWVPEDYEEKGGVYMDGYVNLCVKILMITTSMSATVYSYILFSRQYL